jgi:hypothetical protein
MELRCAGVHADSASSNEFIRHARVTDVGQAHLADKNVALKL